MAFSKEYKEAQRYTNMNMRQMCDAIQTRPNWRARIIMQSFFGHTKNGKLLKFNIEKK